MGNPVVHFELWSDDPARISSFYETTFGWKIQEIPSIDYRIVDTGGKGGINGGILKPKKGPWPAKLAFYIDVDDCAAFVEKIAAAGGKIVVDREEVPGVGVFALFEDPEGRLVGIWQKR